MISIQDRIELHELAGRYGDVIDDRDWPALETIFTQDAIFEVVDLVTMTGLAGIRQYMEHEGRHPLAHLITNIHVTEHGPQVGLRCRGIFPILSPQGGAGNRVFYGSYYDRVVKEPGGWRIAHRVFSTQRRSRREGSNA